MRFEGLHHVTAITADAQRNVDFYAGVLGLRLVKKTVNFDAPEVYHLYYGDERGTPGSIMTFFEFPGVRPGRPGAGMVHTVCWRRPPTRAARLWEGGGGEVWGGPPGGGMAHSVCWWRAATVVCDFWGWWLGEAVLERTGRALRFRAPGGRGRARVVNEEVVGEPLAAAAGDVPAEHAIQGFH